MSESQRCLLIIVLEQARELLAGGATPQLLNNIAVLEHIKGNLPAAQPLYQSAWERAMKLSEDDVASDTRDMLITLSYNLGRLEEDSDNREQAKKTYEGILKKHSDYTDGILVPNFTNSSFGSTMLSRCNSDLIRSIFQTLKGALTHRSRKP